jgi:hypothetical protein
MNICQISSQDLISCLQGNGLSVVPFFQQVMSIAPEEHLISVSDYSIEHFWAAVLTHEDRQQLEAWLKNIEVWPTDSADRANAAVISRTLKISLADAIDHVIFETLCPDWILVAKEGRSLPNASAIQTFLAEWGSIRDDLPPPDEGDGGGGVRLPSGGNGGGNGGGDGGAKTPTKNDRYGAQSTACAFVASNSYVLFTHNACINSTLGLAGFTNPKLTVNKADYASAPNFDGNGDTPMQALMAQSIAGNPVPMEGQLTPQPQGGWQVSFSPVNWLNQAVNTLAQLGGNQVITNTPTVIAQATTPPIANIADRANTAVVNPSASAVNALPSASAANPDTVNPDTVNLGDTNPGAANPGAANPGDMNLASSTTPSTTTGVVTVEDRAAGTTMAYGNGAGMAVAIALNPEGTATIRVQPTVRTEDAPLVKSSPVLTLNSSSVPDTMMSGELVIMGAPPIAAMPTGSGPVAVDPMASPMLPLPTDTPTVTNPIVINPIAINPIAINLIAINPIAINPTAIDSTLNPSVNPTRPNLSNLGGTYLAGAFGTAGVGTNIGDVFGGGPKGGGLFSVSIDGAIENPPTSLNAVGTGDRTINATAMAEVFKLAAGPGVLTLIGYQSNDRFGLIGGLSYDDLQITRTDAVPSGAQIRVKSTRALNPGDILAIVVGVSPDQLTRDVFMASEALLPQSLPFKSLPFKLLPTQPLPTQPLPVPSAKPHSSGSEGLGTGGSSMGRKLTSVPGFNLAASAFDRPFTSPLSNDRLPPLAA